MFSLLHPPGYLDNIYFDAEMNLGNCINYRDDRDLKLQSKKGYEVCCCDVADPLVPGYEAVFDFLSHLE